MEKSEADKVSEELARRDLGDIHALRENDAFNRYFLRRLKQTRDKLDKSFREDPPTKVSHAEREILRRLIASYDELAGLCSAAEEGRLLVTLKRAAQ